MRLAPEIEGGEPGYLNGQPLLDEEGMQALDTLTGAYRGYEDAEKLNNVELAAIDQEIRELQERKKMLEGERSREVSKQGKLRHDGRYGVEKAVERPGGSDVYKHVLAAVAEDGQNALWYPMHFNPADRTGRALTVLDEQLRCSRTSQPVLNVWGRSTSAVDTNEVDQLIIRGGITTPLQGLQLKTKLEGEARRHMVDKRYFAEVPIREDSHFAVNIFYDGSNWVEHTKEDSVEHTEEGEIQPSIGGWRTDSLKPLAIQIRNRDIFGGSDTPALYEENGEIYSTTGEERPFGCVAIGAKAIELTLRKIDEGSYTARQNPRMFNEMMDFVAKRLGVELTPVQLPV